ncbi:MAG: hypothetical protein ABEI98_00080 [Halorhabdus sp.]
MNQAKSQSKQSGNGNGKGQWNDELDAYEQLLAASPDLDLDTNFGLGNYNERIFYEQIANYRKAAKANELFQRIILQRAIHETKLKLAEDGIHFYDEGNMEPQSWAGVDEEEPESRRRLLRERGDEIWQALGDANRALSDKQVNAVVRKTGHDLDWQSFYAKVLAFYHESSRSVDAELIRDFLTGIQHLRSDADPDTAKSLLGGKS